MIYEALYNDIPNTPEDLKSVKIGFSVLEQIRRGPTKDRTTKRNQYDREKGSTFWVESSQVRRFLFCRPGVLRFRGRSYQRL